MRVSSSSTVVSRSIARRFGRTCAADLDADKVVAAVEHWNDLCEQGSDPEGKMSDEFLCPIARPPYYGMALELTEAPATASTPAVSPAATMASGS